MFFVVQLGLQLRAAAVGGLAAGPGLSDFQGFGVGSQWNLDGISMSYQSVHWEFREFSWGYGVGSGGCHGSSPSFQNGEFTIQEPSLWSSRGKITH